MTNPQPPTPPPPATPVPLTYTPPGRVSRPAISAIVWGILAIPIAGLGLVVFDNTGAALVGILALIPGLAAVLRGFAALKQIRQKPVEFRGRGLAQAGIVMGACISLAVLGLIITSLVLAARSRAMDESWADEYNMIVVLRATRDYAKVHGGNFPPHLAVLVAEGSIAPEHLVVRRETAATLPPDLAPKAWRSIAADFDAHCDFLYVAPDFHLDPDRAATFDPSVIVLYSKTSSPSGRHVAFADGHVERVHTADLPRLFADCNRARATLKLPPITLDVPPRPPP